MIRGEGLKSVSVEIFRDYDYPDLCGNRCDAGVSGVGDGRVRSLQYDVRFEMMRKISAWGGVAALLLLLALVFSGCTEHERRGYSAIPQNTPADWEARPYGSLRN